MKMLKVILSAAALMLAAGVSAQTVEDVDTKYNECVELYSAKKYAEVIPQLEQLVQMAQTVGPEAAETMQNAQRMLMAANFVAGGTAVNAKDYENGLKYLNETAEIAELVGDIGMLTRAQGLISKIYSAQAADAFNSGDYPVAAGIYQKGYDANPKDTQLGLNLALTYCKMGQKEQGYGIYQAIIALGDTHSKFKPDAEEAKKQLTGFMLEDASAFAKENRGAEALAQTGAIMQIDPANDVAALLSLQTANNMKDYKAIIGFGEGYAEMQPTPETKSEAYFYLGMAYQNQENKAKAIELYKKVVAGSNVATAKAQIAALSK